MKTKTIHIIIIFIFLLACRAYPRKIFSLPDLIDPQSLRINNGLAYIAETDRIFIYDLNTGQLIRVIGNFKPLEKSSLVPMLDEKDIVMDVFPGQLLVNNDRHLLYYSERGELQKKIPLPPISDYFLPVGKNFISTSIGFFLEKMSYRQQIFLYKSHKEKIKILRESPFGIFGPDTISLEHVHHSLFPHCYKFRVAGDRIIVGNTRNGFFFEVFDSSGKKLYEINRKKANVRPEKKLIDAFEKRLKKYPAWKLNRGWLKVDIPDTVPEFRDFQVSGDRIYVLTFSNRNNFVKILVLDPNGTIKKKDWLPLADLYSISNEKYYYLKENPYRRWELRVSDINSEPFTGGKDSTHPEKPFDNRTDLHRAILVRNVKLALSLVDRTSAIDGLDDYGYTPLMCAARTNSVDVARKLIEKKADLNRVNQVGYTPLHWACRLGFRKMAEFLLAAGAATDRKDALGKTPLELAAGNNFRKIINLFYPLHLAIEADDLQSVESILGRNPGLVNQKDSFGRTPLHLAERFKRVRIRQMLLARNANPDHKDDFGFIPADYTGSAIAARTGVSQLSETTEKAVDDCVYDVLKDYDHINVGLVKNGKVVLTRSYGNNSLNKSEVYASVSKVVTTMVFMQLLAEGKIRSLDDDIRAYSRKYKDCLPEKYNTTPITFRHLLTHTSGIPHSQGTIFNRGKLSLIFAPGSGRMYTTAGFGVLGELMEEISGKSFDRLVREYIGKPVRASSFWAEDTFNCPGARIHSNILDMARFAAGVINHLYVSSEVLYDRICSPYKGRLTLGWGCSHIGTDNLTLSHAGSNGKPRAIIMVKPRKQLAVCILGIHKSRSGGLRFIPLIKNLMKVLKK